MPLDQHPVEESVYDNPDPGVFGTDPQDVQPSTRPSPSSNAPGDDGGTSGEDSPAAEAVPPEPVKQFDPKWQEEFVGLLHIGALRDSFEWLGHRFVIRTLTTGELAEVCLVVKRYQGTEFAAKAWQAATVAACVITVDGKPMPAPLTTEPGDTPFQNRFEYVMRSWYPPVLDAIYDRYLALEFKVREVLDAMGNRSG